MALIGLDIGSSSIKAVQLEKSGTSFSLIAAGITASPPKGMASEAEEDLKKVAGSIKKLLQDAKMTTKAASLSLPESQVFTRMVTLPPLSDEEVASAISWQAEPYIPIPVEEASIQHQIIGRREGGAGKPPGVDVLLVAAPKKLVQKYVRVAELAGLSTSLVETELLALAAAVAPPKGTVIILDMGASSTDLGIVSNGQLLASRSISTGGDVLTRSATTGLSIDQAQAEEYKKTYGLSLAQLEGKVRQALEPTFSVVINEIKKATQYYKDELGGQEPISAAFLSGGTTRMPEIVPYLAEKLGIEVSIANPFSKLAGSEKLSKSYAAYGPFYSVAIGLAMEE